MTRQQKIMSDYNYDAEDTFEEYICFSAVLEQKFRTASDALEELADMDEPDPEYVQQVVKSVMKPLTDLMEHKIGKYPWSSENIKSILMMCGDKKAARMFIKNQYALYEDYYALLPVCTPKEKADAKWNEVKTGFETVLKELE